MTHRMRFSAGFLAGLLAAACLPGFSAGIENRFFRLEYGTAGIIGLKNTQDPFQTDFIRAGGALGDVGIRYRMEGARWQEVSAVRMADRLIPRESLEEMSRTEIYRDRYYLYHGDFNDHYADLELVLRFRLEGDALFWTIRLRNLSGKPLSIGDLWIPLPFNTERRWDTEEMLTRRVYAHRFVSGNGSFIFWMRPNSIGPYLVMTPLGDCPSFESKNGFRPTHLEYFDEAGVYIHSRVGGPEAEAGGGSWRFPHTGVTLAPAADPGSEAAYGFKFRWAGGYDGVRDILYEEGLVDVRVVPGMTVPEDLEARLALRTREDIKAVTPEHPDETRLEYLGEKEKDLHLYRIRFMRLGENELSVEYGPGRKLHLEFFVTEPLETLIKKRAAHLVARQQHRDPAKWYDGLFSDWDMRSRVLRSPDDTDGLKQYWLSCDDPGLCKAPFIAAKNAHFPDRKEIEAVEYYIEHFLWGKQQRSDRESYPYGIYGIPNWKVNRESGPENRDGWVGHLWRLYDYPHVIMLYLNMYRVARRNPDMTGYLGWEGYLERAFGTSKAYFTVPLETGNWPADSLGIMAEVVIEGVIDALEREGCREQAAWLRGKWEEKVEVFINQRPNFFYAEYPFGPCAFESTQAFAHYAVELAGRPGTGLEVSLSDAMSFMDEQIAANICLRGWIEPAYYLLGSSSPGSLFYMTHLGGWALLDYALNFAPDPAEYLRLGYASYLCGWGLMNTGKAESGFGYWYPGRENDGGAGTGFTSTALGERHGKLAPRGVWYYGGEADLGFGAALRTAATIAAEDPLFGPLAFGGRLDRRNGSVEVVPMDGLRQRFSSLLSGRRFHMELEGAGFAAGRPIVFKESLAEIRCRVEKRTGGGIPARLALRGLPEGNYEIRLGGQPIESFESAGEGRLFFDLPVGLEGSSLEILRKRNPGRTHVPSVEEGV